MRTYGAGGMDTDLNERTRRLWERRAGRPLTEEDFRQIAENLTGYFGLLIKWDGQQGSDDQGRAAQDTSPVETKQEVLANSGLRNGRV